MTTFSRDPKSWVGAPHQVEARFATGDDVRAVGKVIDYTDRPTVIIETADGTHVSWIADLCVPVEGGDTTP